MDIGLVAILVFKVVSDRVLDDFGLIFVALIDRFNHVVFDDRRDWDQVGIEDDLEGELLFLSL